MPPKKQSKNAPPPPPEPQPEPQIPPQQLAGTSRFQFPSGNIYQGEWKLINGKKVRDGQVQSQPVPSSSFSQTYKGFWKNDKQDGQGQYHYANGAHYKGNWKNGLQHGYGTMQFPDGDIYEGQWQNQMMHGQGQLYDRRGNLTSGIWVKGCYKSTDQQKLKVLRQIQKKKDIIILNAKKFFPQFQKSFAKSDKKTMKENLQPYFNNQQIKQYYKQPYLKYQQMPPQKWNACFAFCQKQIKICQVPSPDDKLLFLDRQRILTKNKYQSGQVVQIVAKQGQRTVKLGLVLLHDNINFVAIFISDSAQQQGKKK